MTTPAKCFRLAVAAIAVAGTATVYAEVPESDAADKELQQVKESQQVSVDQTGDAEPQDIDSPDLATDEESSPIVENDAANSDELHPIIVDPHTGQYGGKQSLADKETPEEELLRYFQLYKNAMENETYAEADSLAKRVVELSIGIFGIDNLDSARALTNLGIAQHKNEDYASAILNYKAAIDIIERVTDRLNANLVNPLKGLGAAQLAEGRPDLAVDTFDRAVHVTHVNEGPHNLEQVDVLESLAETYLSVGELDHVEEITGIIFGLEARGVDLESMDILPVLEKQAYWQHRLSLFDKERYTWRKIIDIVEEQLGEDALALIPPLTGLGKSYLYIGQAEFPFQQATSITSGEVYLKRAVRIAEDNPEASWKLKEDTMLALGDFYILSGQAGRAENIYEDAWNLLSGDEEQLQYRREELQTLTVLQDINPPKYVGMDGEATNRLPGEDFETGKLVYHYSVSSRGFTTNIVLVEAEPAAFEDMQREVTRDISSRVYRPKMVDGKTVDTDGLTYTHRFFYRLSDLPDATTPESDVATTD